MAAGFATDICMLATLVDARMRDHRLVVPAAHQRRGVEDRALPDAFVRAPRAAYVDSDERRRRRRRRRATSCSGIARGRPHGTSTATVVTCAPKTASWPMPEVRLNEEALRRMLKDALGEALEERRDLLYGIVAEVLNDYTLSDASKEALDTETVNREDVKRRLRGEA
jgi:hypothetical protein